MSCPAQSSSRLYRRHIAMTDQSNGPRRNRRRAARQRSRRMGYWLFGSIREDESPKRDFCLITRLAAIRA
jgi:hypothetical protein